MRISDWSSDVCSSDLFKGNHAAVATVLDAGLTVFAQNVETVERLTHVVRDARAGYGQTLGVLAFAKRHAPKTLTQTSLMLGLGEHDHEIEQAIIAIRAATVAVVPFAQYMRPTQNTLPVQRFVTPHPSQNHIVVPTWV